jgi:hypothetical protein
MKRIGVVVLILCAGFVSVAGGQQPLCKHPSPWGEFHRHNMMRWNPCENVLNTHNVGKFGIKWSYEAGGFLDSSPTVANGIVYAGSDDAEITVGNQLTLIENWPTREPAKTDSAARISPLSWRIR